MYIDPQDLCQCGHLAEDHHTSWIPGDPSYQLIEECEYYGTNDTGGMEYIEQGPGEPFKWVEHCYKFQLAPFELSEEVKPYFDFQECDLEAFVDEFERTDPDIRKKIANIRSQMEAMREDPDEQGA